MTVRGNSEEEVYIKLKNAIRKRYIKQGSQLVEVSLAQQLGVSRTPVRSAIKRLEAEGMVNSIPNRGAFVVTPTSREIEETYQVRMEMECMAARLTAAIITDSQIKELNQLVIDEGQVFDRTNLEGYDVTNACLHLKIAEFSGNSILYHYVKELLDRTRIYLILFDPFFKLEYSPTVDAHQKIVNALAEHSAQKAEAAIREHLQNSVDGLEKVETMPEDYLAL
ncbi:GntR family transcriptional regulator [Desulfopila aestuarii]|uniref:DNA-binding transcriptional regulator, GntR family n=1 Tax=Desulfopila aestuarii DSM 18488 TaxID=1121416 RepID=A0A1M7YC12_9BACT|nr:GntR family transcriptional regulator [Desulfopila aestuarii]SHO50182.1 DNA-binding transcriptional regulator, GntR family [Desulfopila aestuarii DSM 18488]